MLPSEEALLLRNDLTGTSRVIDLAEGTASWPIANRLVFFSDGRYHARLPVGDYDLIVAKGPEFRFARYRVSLRADETKVVKIELRVRLVDRARRKHVEP